MTSRREHPRETGTADGIEIAIGTGSARGVLRLRVETTGIGVGSGPGSGPLIVGLSATETSRVGVAAGEVVLGVVALREVAAETGVLSRSAFRAE